MSKKATGFNLINSNFRQMPTCTSRLHKLLSREFWPLCTEHSTSRVKTQSYFKDQPVYRWETQEMERLFFQKNTVIFITVSSWCQSSSIIVMTVNTATWLNHRKQFSKIMRKACYLYYLWAALKRLAFNSSAIMCYVMKTENIKLQKYFTLLLNIRWNHTIKWMAS